MLSLLLETAAALTGRAANRQVQREGAVSQLSQGREEAMGKAEVFLLSSQPAQGLRWVRWKHEVATDHCPNLAECLQ